MSPVVFSHLSSISITKGRATKAAVLSTDLEESGKITVAAG